MLGYQLARLEVTFAAKAVDVVITAARVPAPKDGHVAEIAINGGVPAIDDALRPFLKQQASTLFRPRPVDYLDVLQDAATIEARYRAAGHLDARVASLQLRRCKEGGIAITFVVERGRRYRLGKVSTTYENEQTAKLAPADAVKAEPGAPWSASTAGEIAERTRSWLYSKGYLDAKAEASVAPRDDGTVDVIVAAHEAERCVLNQIVLRGAGEHAGAIREAARLERGKPIDPTAVERLRHAIEDLAAFERVEMLFVPLRDQPPGRRDLVIRLEPLDLGRKIGKAERLYYRIARRIIELHNAGRDGVTSLRLDGFLTVGGRRTTVAGTLRRPDFIDVGTRVGGRRPLAVRFVRAADRSALIFRGEDGSPTWTVRLPRGVAVGLRFDVLPPARGLDGESEPTQVAMGAAVTGRRAGKDVLVLGSRCPPVAAYATRHARSFAKVPPRLARPDSLVLPPASDGDGPTQAEVGPDAFPRRIVRRDARGAETLSLRLRLNPPVAEVDVAAARKALEGENNAEEDALVVPLLIALSLHDEAANHADTAQKRHPRSAACQAAKGLLELTQNADLAGLDLLRRAAAKDGHPAYRVLLAETLLRLKRFDEASKVCATELPAKQPPLTAADVLLASSLSTRAILGLLSSDTRDYRRRLAVDGVLAHIGAGRHAEGADAARALRKARPRDAQVIELLARCELGRGDPKATLAALAAVEPKDATPPMHVYAALAHLHAKDLDLAVPRLRRAVAAAPELGNLLYLQRHAAELDGHFAQAEPKAALAEAFSRAARGPLEKKRRNQLVAIVNDAYILRPEVDQLAARLLRAAAAKDEESALELARERLIEDILIVRWAMWSGITLDTDGLAETLEAEMERLGAEDIAAYRERLKQMGTSLEERRRLVAESALKRQAFTRIIADRVRIDPEEVAEYYREHPKQFRIPRRARFRMISLHHVRFPRKERAVQMARALLAELKAGRATFAALAKQYSHDPNAKRGGVWQEVAEGSLLKPLDEAVFALKPGDLSGVIQTDRGCHVVEMEAIEPARNVPLAEAAEHIVRAMQEVKGRRALAGWIAEWRERSFVKTFHMK
jgi:hypothetical protein